MEDQPGDRTGNLGHGEGLMNQRIIMHLRNTFPISPSLVESSM